MEQVDLDNDMFDADEYEFDDADLGEYEFNDADLGEYDGIFNILEENSELYEVSNEQYLDNSDNSLLISHNSSFEQLLSDYVQTAERNQKVKYRMKIAFFIISMFLFVSLPITLIGVSIYSVYGLLNSDANLVNLIVPFVSLLGSTLTSIIVIPEIIAKYLFDPSEDKNLSDIIANMQKYDMSIRNSRK